MVRTSEKLVRMFFIISSKEFGSGCNRFGLVRCIQGNGFHGLPSQKILARGGKPRLERYKELLAGGDRRLGIVPPSGVLLHRAKDLRRSKRWRPELFRRLRR